VSLNQEEAEELDSWLLFLQQAHDGILMNRVTIRKPSTKICWSDSCPFGVGGFLVSGKAWRVRIPQSSPIYRVDEANNVLEFLGMVVTVWLAILESKELGEEQECILAIGDNASAIGWLYRSSKLQPGSPNYKPVQMIARQLARLIINSTLSCEPTHQRRT
jgi:hypothetical protein